MTNRTLPYRLAGTAIAAFLALSSTSTMAQDAAPAADTPAADTSVPGPVVQPAPTIVLPPVVAVEAAPSPVAQTAPDVEPVPAARTRAVVAPRAAPATESRAASVAPVAAGPESTDAAPASVAVESSDVAGAVTAEVPPVEPIEAFAPAEDNESDGLWLAGLAGALGLGAIGLFAVTRRRRVVRDSDAVTYEPVSAPAKPVAASPRPATLVAPAFNPMARWSEPRVPVAQPADTHSLNLNREALLERMVAAEPDANNPFTSAKGRRRRARLMLQSMESNRWDDAELAPGFDWREMAQAVEKRETVKV